MTRPNGRQEVVSLLRRAAPVVGEFGPIHALIAEGLLAEAAAIEEGHLGPDEVPVSVDLALTYLDESNA